MVKKKPSGFSENRIKPNGFFENRTKAKKADNDNDNDNDNENDNDIRYISLSETEVSTSDTAKAGKQVKHKYGEFKHVLLKDKELQALQKEFNNWEELIKYLDEYIEMKGTKYKSHYMAIRKWVVDAVKEQNRKKDKTVQSDTKEESDVWKELQEKYEKEGY